MKVKGLDGKTYKLSLGQKVVGNIDTRSRSTPHKIARKLLLKIYPFDPPHEEVTIPGCGTPLYLDFLLPQRRLAIEVHGEQHRKYSKYFHGSPSGFTKQRERDRRKAEWCELNGLVLVALHDNDIDGWEAVLRAAFDGPGEAE